MVLEASMITRDLSFQLHSSWPLFMYCFIYMFLTGPFLIHFSLLSLPYLLLTKSANWDSTSPSRCCSQLATTFLSTPTPLCECLLWGTPSIWHCVVIIIIYKPIISHYCLIYLCNSCKFSTMNANNRFSANAKEVTKPTISGLNCLYKIWKNSICKGFHYILESNHLPYLVPDFTLAFLTWRLLCHG